MKKLFLAIFFLIFTVLIKAQIEFRKNLNRDSLIEILIRDFPEVQKIEFKKDMVKADDDAKNYIIAVLYDTNYTKTDLIKNLNDNRAKIEKLKSEYAKLIPSNYIVQFEINKSEITIPKKTYSISIYKLKSKKFENQFQDNIREMELVSYNFSIHEGSEKLKSIMRELNWEEHQLKEIEKLLSDANCFSIRNGNPNQIKFKRSGFGVLSYKLFDERLTDEQKIIYSDGCNSIYFKDNIVLVSDNGQDGAKGALCF